MGFISEFKDFAMRGNVVDMAVGIVIGGAFGNIVSSFVSDVIMPPIGMLLGGVDFNDLKVVMKQAVIEGGEVVAPAVSINYGSFINMIIDFLLIALAIFSVIKFMNKMKKQEEPAPEPEAAPEPTTEEKLLAEIRDLLKK